MLLLNQLTGWNIEIQGPTPLIGFVLAAGLAGELGDPKHLGKLDSLRAYAGIVPRTTLILLTPLNDIYPVFVIPRPDPMADRFES